MKKMKKTLATLALGLTLGVAPLVAQSIGIKKINTSYASKIDKKTNTLYGNKFNASEPEVGENKNSIEGRGINIYFRNDEHVLDSGDISDFKQYSSITGDYVGNIKIEASADKNASSDYNLGLSQRRSNSVEDVVRKLFPKANIETVALGERPGEDLAERRKVKLTIDNPISYQIENSKADYLLLDFSGSMNEILPGTKIKKVSTIWNSKIPTGIEAYYFSGKSESNELGSIFPDGDTPLYNSIYEIIKIAKIESVIDIYTDGLNSKLEGYNSKNIIDEANKKNIKLNMKSIGIPENKKEIYEKISNDTYGKSFFMR